MSAERRVLNAVIYEREPPIARIILNRPDKANTKDAQLVEEVDACLHEADRDREIKVVILKANGKGFCGGYDLVRYAQESATHKWTQEGHPWDPMVDYAGMKRNTEDFMSLWRCSKPTSAAISPRSIG